ncbi:MAG: uroporphyrinogen decarboxylase [Cyclobacteriaceae bacterium]|nr:uroporphyrinogen decarboxylase [Cyclobacteriaceae bacterium]
MLKNDLLLKALRREAVDRPPVWMMRQAGRYLPDFRKLKTEHEFFNRVQNPELACEITVMPVKQVGVDAAILFSDILVIPQAMNVEVVMVEGKGPVITNPIRTKKQIEALVTTDMADRLGYVMKAIELTLKELNGSVPLIGFAGAPWTIFCYLIEGGGSKTFDKARQFCFAEPELTHLLLNKITEATIQYLQAKVKAGVHAIQLFDSWAGVLSPDDYETYSLPYNKKIIQALNTSLPVIFFAKDIGFGLENLLDSGATALGLDWTIPPDKARAITQNKITLQGNFDPTKLLASPKFITEEVNKMITAFGTQRYIANLGHGILPNVPVENAIAFVEAVKNYRTT